MGAHRKKIAALVGAAVLAAPSAAAGQGAVDEQYRDPFAGQDDSGSDTAQPAPSDDSAPSAPPASAPAAPAPTAGTPAELPRTGLLAAPVAAAGIALLAAGAALRRRLR